MKRYLHSIRYALIIILVIGFLLRLHNLTVWPRHGATFDEFAWTWLGINLIQKGVPISWSPHPQYTYREHVRHQGAAFWVVKPYLEHPPLFGLIAGSFSLLNGAKDMYEVTLHTMRPLALLFGTVSILAIFLLMNQLYGVYVGLLTSLLYATIPTIVVGSRIVQNENFLIPVWLFALFFITKYLKTNKKRYRNIAAIIAGLLSLAKVPWLVAGFSLSIIMAYRGKWKDTFIVGSISLLLFSLYIIYGVYYDKELFIKLLQLQTARYDISFNGFFSIFTSPLLVDRYYLDGWILFGWIAIALLFRDIKKHFLIIFPFLAYLIIYIAGIPDEPGHGWYRYPFYPFLVASIALFLKEYFVENRILTFLFLVFIGFSLFHSSWVNMFGFSYTLYRLIILGFLLVLTPLFIKSSFLTKTTKVVSYIWLFFFILLNIWSVILYNEQ